MTLDSEKSLLPTLPWLPCDGQMLVSVAFDSGAKSLAPQIQVLGSRFDVLGFEDFKHETQLVSYIFLSADVYSSARALRKMTEAPAV